jgi:hypothetical protein
MWSGAVERAQVQTHALADEEEQDRHRHTIAAPRREIGGDQLVADVPAERVGMVVSEWTTAVPLAALVDRPAQRGKLRCRGGIDTCKRTCPSRQPVELGQGGVDIYGGFHDPVEGHLGACIIESIVGRSQYLPDDGNGTWPRLGTCASLPSQHPHQQHRDGLNQGPAAGAGGVASCLHFRKEPR